MKGVFSVRGFLPFLIVMFINAVVDLGHKITIQNILFKSIEDENLQIILTSLVNLLILLPYIMLFSVSGFLNDKFSRTRITRYAAASEILLTLFITISYLCGWFYVAFGTTLLLAVQSAIYSPAKYGLIKKIVGGEKLGAANGIVQAFTIVAILLGSFVFSAIFESYAVASTDAGEMIKSVWFIGAILFVCSVAETIFTFKIPFFEATDAGLKFDAKKYFKLGYLKENTKHIFNNKNAFLCTLGLSVFWAVAQLVIAVFPAHYKAMSADNNVMIVQAILAVSTIGLVAGSALAGSYSKNHIEMGIVPFGALGLFASLLMFAQGSSAAFMTLASFLFGFSGGIFIVPLNANIQFFTSEEQMGRTLAGSNFIQNIFMAAFLLLAMAFSIFAVSTPGIFVITSFSVLICALATIKYLPHLFARLLIMPFFRIGYTINVDGVENIPQKGGVLLLGNHMSWIDWAVLQMASPRPIRFAMHKSFYEIWYLKWLLNLFDVIPIGAGASKSALEKIRECLDAGDVVALFPEGHISYNGQIDEFQHGYEIAASDTNSVIVPFYLRGLWGSSFSRAQKYYQRISRKVDGKRAIRVSFGAPLAPETKAPQVREKVVELSFFSWAEYLKTLEPMQFSWLKHAKADLFKRSMVDSTGADLNNLKVIATVLVFLSKFKFSFLKERHVGVILPSSVMGSIINLMLFIRGKISVNLNYTLSEQNLIGCADKAKLKSIITSRQFIAKLKARGFELEESLKGRLIYLEDVAQGISKADKICAMLKAILMPRWLLELIYFRDVRIDDEAAILFSSGSEGTPKGIVLTHKNIMANIKQISEIINTDGNDVILASLPIFHSFGLTAATFFPLSEGIATAHVPDPTDAFAVGKMVAKYHATIMFGTSTFFRLYTKNKKLNPLMFSTIRYAIAGAEKLNAAVKREFKMKFGVEIYEGYGTTETTPVVSVNTANVLEPEFFKELVFSKEGSVGLPTAGTIIRICDPTSLAKLENGQAGLILIGGHQVMKGYYEDEERTKEAIVELDGVRYYNSGDIGFLDEAGFLTITDRLSRFAKIGGEMISLGAVEAQISSVLGDEVTFVCTNVADEKKGEQVVMLFSGEISEEEVAARIRASAIPSIMQPSKIYKVEAVPVLGTGKVDFKSSKKLAAQLVAGEGNLGAAEEA